MLALFFGKTVNQSSKKSFRFYKEEQMKIGEIAPDFSLKDLNGDSWTLHEHLGKTVVLLFYPGDNTPVCTAQLCIFASLRLCVKSLPLFHSILFWRDAYESCLTTSKISSSFGRKMLNDWTL